VTIRRGGGHHAIAQRLDEAHRLFKCVGGVQIAAPLNHQFALAFSYLGEGCVRVSRTKDSKIPFRPRYASLRAVDSAGALDVLFQH
jgi:hypothetical protein